jgi:hypothetical protein
MTMDETQLAPLPPERVKRKYWRRRVSMPATQGKQKSSEADISPSDEFAGLSLRTCATACNVNKCVISGDFVCVHPQQSGMAKAKQPSGPPMTLGNMWAHSSSGSNQLAY